MFSCDGNKHNYNKTWVKISYWSTRLRRPSWMDQKCGKQHLSVFEHKNTQLIIVLIGLMSLYLLYPFENTFRICAIDYKNVHFLYAKHFLSVWKLFAVILSRFKLFDIRMEKTNRFFFLWLFIWYLRAGSF